MVVTIYDWYTSFCTCCQYSISVMTICYLRLERDSDVVVKEAKYEIRVPQLPLPNYYWKIVTYSLSITAFDSLSQFLYVSLVICRCSDLVLSEPREESWYDYWESEIWIRILRVSLFKNNESNYNPIVWFTLNWRNT